jgi:5-enolpyruvylshikimate-3-phosphate synthase
MELTVENPAIPSLALEPHALPLKRAKRLRGMPALSGDHGLAYQALALASLANRTTSSGGATRIENLPDTPAMREALEAFAALGLLRSELLDGQSVVHGGSLESPSTNAPIVVRDETLALVLAGLIDGKGLSVSLAPDSASVGADISRLIAMTGELTTKLRRARDTGNAFKPKALKLDEPSAKVLLLTRSLASGEAAQLDLAQPGTDLFESLAAHFDAPLQVDRGEPPEGDELARRIARQMRAAGNKEDLVRYRLETGDVAAGSGALKPAPLTLPRDVSEASLWALIATLIKGSDIVLDGVLLNASRTAFFSALRRMGADLEVTTRREKHGFAYGQVRVRSSELIAKRFDAESLSGMRDETFLLIVAAAFAEGETVLRDVTYLRGYREDLLKSFLGQLKAAGVEAGEFEDGVVVRGRPDYDGTGYDAAGHPGLAAACAAMALKSHGESLIQGAEGLLWRMPHFLGQLEMLQSEAKAEAKAENKTENKADAKTSDGEAA